MTDALPRARFQRRISHVTERSPSTARTWAREQLSGLGYAPDLAELAVSEFLTNVLRYAAGSALIALALAEDGSLEVACTDRHPETADDVHPTDGNDETGRGLFILAMLAVDGVQVETDPRRKRVAVRLPIGGTS